MGRLVGVSPAGARRSLRRSGCQAGGRRRDPGQCSHGRKSWKPKPCSSGVGRSARSPGICRSDRQHRAGVSVRRRVPGVRRRPAGRMCSSRSPATSASAWPMIRTCGRRRCSTRCSSWATRGRTRRSPGRCGRGGCARTASRAAGCRAGTGRSSTIRQVRKPSGTGSSCPTRPSGGGGAGRRICWSGRWRTRRGGAAVLAESEDQPHLIEALDGVARRLGGLTQRWRFDRMATVCHPDSGAADRHLRSGRGVLPGRGRRFARRGAGTARGWWRRPTTPPRSAGGAPWPTRFTGPGARPTWTGSACGSATPARAAARTGPRPRWPSWPPPSRCGDADRAVPGGPVRRRADVSAQALVAFRGNSYSVPPGDGPGPTVTVGVPVGARGHRSTSCSPGRGGAGPAPPRNPTAPARWSATTGTSPRWSTRCWPGSPTGPPCRGKTRRPPSPAARAEAARLRGEPDCRRRPAVAAVLSRSVARSSSTSPAYVDGGRGPAETRHAARSRDLVNATVPTGAPAMAAGGRAASVAEAGALPAAARAPGLPEAGRRRRGAARAARRRPRAAPVADRHAGTAARGRGRRGRGPPAGLRTHFSCLPEPATP